MPRSMLGLPSFVWSSRAVLRGLLPYSNLLAPHQLPLGVIVTDSEQVLINALADTIPRTRRLLCQWLIARNILGKCKVYFAAASTAVDAKALFGPRSLDDILQDALSSYALLPSSNWTRTGPKCRKTTQRHLSWGTLRRRGFRGKLASYEHGWINACMLARRPLLALTMCILLASVIWRYVRCNRELSLG